MMMGFVGWLVADEPITIEPVSERNSPESTLFSKRKNV